MIDISKGKFWDLPWSLVDGCTPCSPGCDHCWSAAMTHRFNFQWTKDGKPEFNGHITVRPERLSIPLKRRKPTVYACWNDLYHEAVPDEFIGDAWQIMAECSEKHTFLILTKRAERAAEITNKYSFVDFGNVYHGLTVCNQQEADEKIPVFLHVQGKKFLSIEPCLGEIKLFGDDYDWTENGRDCKKSCINSVILGGETGPGARPMHPDWAISIVRQCRAAGVPFFFKGWGEWTPEIPPKYCKLSGKRWSHESVSWARDGSKYNPLYPPPDHFPSVTVYRAGRKAAGRLLDGREWNDLLWVKS